MKTCLLLLFGILAGPFPALAETYYVDYAEGRDDASGLSPQSAWKHSPGDAKATGRPQALEPQPGDVIRFKGGVRYRGEIRLKNLRGAEGRPIVLEGNSDGRWGEGPAVLDGAETIRGWKPVDSPEPVGGNPRWRQIVYADLDVDLSDNFSQERFILHRDGGKDRQAPWQRLFLIDGERRVLPISQWPKPSDPFFPDLPEDFQVSPVRVNHTYPHRIYYPEGSRGNANLPLLAITHGGNAPVIQPFNGGEVALDLAAPELIAEIGFRLFRPGSFEAPETIAFYADGEEIHLAEVDQKSSALQRFKLPRPVRAERIVFQLRHANPKRAWTKLQQIAAYDDSGENIIEHEIHSTIVDEERLTYPEADWYEGMFVGVHGGNNHVYFARVQDYDPLQNRLIVPQFSAKTYEQTRYALFNSPKLIDLPGEWALEALGNGKTRVYLLPEDPEAGPPADIGYPVLQTAVSIAGSSAQLEVRGFLMQRYSGGQGGVAVNGRGAERPSDIRIADCEVRFVSGQSGIGLNHSDRITVENCQVRYCPGWTVGIYVNRVNGYALSNTRVDNNSGSGIRHYEAKQGILRNNVVTNHYGMHSSGLNFYEGCRDILFEGNYVQNVIAINRSAENLVFRNNVIDSQFKNAFSMAFWVSGKVGGRHIKNVRIENNTFVNVDPERNWSTSIFVQGGGQAPEDLIVRDNVLSRLRSPFPGLVSGNIFLEDTPSEVAGEDALQIGEPDRLFIDPAKGDFRRKPGGPRTESGADIPPPAQLSNY